MKSIITSKNALTFLLFLLVYTTLCSQDDAFITTWKTDNIGLSSERIIIIPAHPDEIYDYDVDWENDGVYDDFGITGPTSHVYDTAGIYQVAIRGQFPRIFFNNEMDKNKIISIDQWGDMEWTCMKSAFWGCQNLSGQAIDSPNLSQVKSTNKMFAGCSIFNQDIGIWDMSNVEDMELMFLNCSAFNQDIGSWDVSSVTIMRSMFFGCSKFNQDLNAWDGIHVL